MVAAEVVALILALLLFVPLVVVLAVWQFARTPYGMLHLRMAAVLAVLRFVPRFRFREDLRVEWHRRRIERGARLGAGRKVPLERVEDLAIEGPGGSLALRLYHPDGSGPKAIILFFHGGGMVAGSLESHDGVCRRLARHSDAVVVSVGYRLAPENTYPAAVEDAYAALLWASRQGRLIGADGGRIAVAGDSAGGNLAAVAAQMARDRNGPQISHQLLIYPATNLESLDTSSYARFESGYGLSKQEVEWCRSLYLPRRETWVEPYVSPLLARNLRDLPPAYILAAEFDVFLEEGRAYAEKLREAGVDVTYVCWPGVIHGFISMGRFVPQARRALTEAACAARAALAS